VQIVPSSRTLRSTCNLSEHGHGANCITIIVKICQSSYTLIKSQGFGCARIATMCQKGKSVGLADIQLLLMNLMSERSN
jgi:hypothetical protein